MTIVCDCEGHKDGFTNQGVGSDTQWWVHARCGKPTERWLRNQGDEVLNYFKGGPMDGTAYLTASLLSRGAMQLPIPDYRWTPDTITSEKTGAVARVWLHKSIESSPVDVQEGAAVSTEETTAGTPVPADTGDSHQHGGSPSMTDATGADLRARREALKISRPQFAEKLGSTPSKVYRIEADGKRTKPEEVAAYSQLLASLESQANATESRGEVVNDPNAPEGGSVGTPQDSTGGVGGNAGATGNAGTSGSTGTSTP